MDWLIALVTLTSLELVLGIDNIIFISILAGKLPPEQQEKARRIGLGLAMFMRILLLFALSWVIGLTAPLFSVLDHPVSGRDLILIGGACSWWPRAPARFTSASSLFCDGLFVAGRVLQPQGPLGRQRAPAPALALLRH